MSAGGGRRCVVFDLDDTLFLERDYVRSGFDAVGVWAREALGLEGLAESCWARFESGQRGRIFDDVLFAAGLDPAPPLIGQLVQVYRDHRPAIEVLPDARVCLERLRRRGYALAVVTDGPLRSQQRKAEALGVERWADLVVFTEALGPGFGKPHCRAFRDVEAYSGLGGSACTYVADNTVKDFAGPKSLGWATVRVRRPWGLHHAQLSPLDVDTEIEDLSELDRWLSRVPSLTADSGGGDQRGAPPTVIRPLEHAPER